MEPKKLCAYDRLRQEQRELWKKAAERARSKAECPPEVTGVKSGVQSDVQGWLQPEDWFAPPCVDANAASSHGDPSDLVGPPRVDAEDPVSSHGGAGYANDPGPPHHVPGYFPMQADWVEPLRDDAEQPGPWPGPWPPPPPLPCPVASDNDPNAILNERASARIESSQSTKPVTRWRRTKVGSDMHNASDSSQMKEPSPHCTKYKRDSDLPQEKKG